MLRSVLIALTLLPLTACGDGKDGTAISINTSNEAGGGNSVDITKGGEVSVNVPGFSGKMKLPKLQLNADNFDMNGVHLYPGSTISGMNIDGHSGAGDGDGQVRVTFQSPAKPEIVAPWFRDKLTAAGFSVHPDGAGLAGTTDEKKPFKLALTPAGSDKANGVITIE